MTKDEYDRLYKGKKVIVDGKVWARCTGCGRIISISGFFGSIHICSPD